MGYTNAETSYEHTNYHFTVASKTLNKSLKIFSGILKHPHFDINHLKLDVGVVDQEFRDELQNDAFRLEKVSRITGKQSHSHTSYFGGNNATLGFVNYRALQVSLQRIFHSKYSSHRMRLVVIGSGNQFSTPTLTSLAPFNHQIETIVNNFSSIPKTSLDDIEEGDPFKDEPQTILISSTTVKDQNTLLIQFHLQPLHKFLPTKVNAPITVNL
ncbi:hypothetical protein DSO57_1029964 [Entomophthora muscae]|uniref:Uncharacterized protein n=1 Tax=Entomophthora muscae TaxID=34485 RepID=A0ACC2TBZ2_9FUNG|nr:hypothetical protein DSO57_1029964 [Entomophthora muscae]